MAELPTTEPEEEKLYAGNAEADVEICGGLDEHSQQQHPDSVLMELERAKSNLNRTTSKYKKNLEEFRVIISWCKFPSL
jgi:hypothetical protein